MPHARPRFPPHSRHSSLPDAPRLAFLQIRSSCRFPAWSDRFRRLIDRDRLVQQPGLPPARPARRRGGQALAGPRCDGADAVQGTRGPHLGTVQVLGLAFLEPDLGPDLAGDFKEEPPGDTGQDGKTGRWRAENIAAPPQNGTERTFEYRPGAGHQKGLAGSLTGRSLPDADKHRKI